MTINNSEQVSQTDPNQQSNVDQAIAAGATAPQAPLQPTEPEVVDIDAKDLADAVAAVEAEKAAAAGGGGDQQQQGSQPSQVQPQDQQQPAGGQQQPAGDTPMIPKPRLDEALGRATKAEQDAAYWKGVADARAAGTQASAPQGGQQVQQQQQQPTPEQRLAAIHAKQDDIAKRFDDGEITLSDVTKQQRELNSQEATIREEVLQAKLQPQPNQQQRQDGDLYLDKLTAELETPMVKAFDQVATPGDWNYVTHRATENLVARGVDPKAGNIGKLELRKETAKLIEQLTPSLVGDRLKAKGIAIPTAQAPAQQQQQQNQQPGRENLSPEAKARLDKLNLSADAPPNLSRMQGNSNDGTPTDARLETMSDDDIGNLPDATRKKLLGIMPA